MKDEQLLRYSRQIMLPQIDISGQEKLLSAKVLIVGLGGLGCPAAMYLASAGVGQLTLVDDDDVDMSNLQRQIAHSQKNIGQRKVESAGETLKSLNSETQLHYINARLAGEALNEAVAASDVVVDCSDNFTTRFALNAAAFQHKVPLVSGAAIRLEGQVSVFDSRSADSPCYQCLYEEGTDADLNCAENGVLAPLVGIIGSIQAVEAIKLITGTGKTLMGRLLLLDAQSMQFSELRLPKKPDCKVCSQQ